MRYLNILLLPGLFLLACQATHSQEKELPVHQQALVVLTEGWDSLRASMYAIEWRDSGWVLLRQHAAVVGQRGLGWGSGLQDFTDREGPVKQEGDRKSPAGVFTLGTAFGKAPSDSLPAFHLGYRQIVYELQCIEDSDSRFYNELVLEDDPEKDWEQNDRMLREDELYDLGAFVNHNTDPASPGAGSCIFLHLWRTAEDGTLGCTAMDKSQLLNHLRWLNPSKSPILVQVPMEEYAEIAEAYGLPADLRAIQLSR